MITYVTQCPVCGSAEFKDYLSTKDYSVSHETFKLQQCVSCGLTLTNPRPQNAELGKYYASPNYTSHTNQPKTLLDHVYNTARSFTLKWKYNLIQQHSQSTTDSLLDFGCGIGSFLAYCKRKGLRVNGIEPSDDARSSAEQRTGTSIAKSLDEISNQHDVITLWHVLEHVPELNECISQLRDRLKENGTMFIAVPNLNSYDAHHYKHHWAAYDVPRHLWHFSQTTMKQLLAKHNLKITRVLPMPLDAYYVSLLSEKYSGTNGQLSLYTKAIANGFRSNNRAKETKEYSSLIYVIGK